MPDASTVTAEETDHGPVAVRDAMEMVSVSPCWIDILAKVKRIALTSESVLVLGETGVGKEIVSRLIHNLSPRSTGPYVAVNCAAVPDSLVESEFFGHEKGAFTGAIERYAGCFEQAHRGTILLDEIGEMPKNIQARLLRVLEDKKIRRLGGKNEIPVDVRIVAATNRDIVADLKEKRIREDIYYRLVCEIFIPPLRERQQDIMPLIELYFPKARERYHLNPKTALREDKGLADLHAHAWPGNVRELKRMIEMTLLRLPESVTEVKTSDLADTLFKRK